MGRCDEVLGVTNKLKALRGVIHILRWYKIERMHARISPTARG